MTGLLVLRIHWTWVCMSFILHPQGVFLCYGMIILVLLLVVVLGVRCWFSFCAKKKYIKIFLFLLSVSLIGTYIFSKLLLTVTLKNIVKIQIKHYILVIWFDFIILKILKIYFISKKNTKMYIHMFGFDIVK